MDFSSPFDASFSVATAVAVAIPLLYVLGVRYLDLYSSGSIVWLSACLAWGWFALDLARPINDAILARLQDGGNSYAVALAHLSRWYAPAIEEPSKALILVGLVLLPAFTYSVDGAVYGFAAGSGFAILENLLYIARASGDDLALAVSRVGSTALMHAAATGIVGLALGWAKTHRGWQRIVVVPISLAVAYGLHSTFNAVANRPVPSLAPLIAIGAGSAVVLAGAIILALRRERAWMRKNLNASLGVTKGEAAAVVELSDIERVLAPFKVHFGQKRTTQAVELLKLQAQIGVRAHSARDGSGRAVRSSEEQIAELHKQVHALRRSLGVAAMIWLRTALPPEATKSMYDRLLVTEAGGGGGIWDRLGSQMSAPETGPGMSV